MQDRQAPGECIESSGSIPLIFSLRLSRIAVFIALAAQVYVALRFWQTTWDDSAITLGFARTFAAVGRIEPTPGSGIVEGYSTTLWMMLMALAARFTSSPDTLLAIAKISTLLLNLGNILLIRRWFSGWTTELLANLTAASVGCGLMFFETINGMETPLVMTLILVMLLLLPHRSAGARFWYLLAGSALLLTRSEAIWLAIPFILVEKPLRRASITLGTWLSVFSVSNLARWRYFRSLLPNTIVAKRGFPYSARTPHLELLRHIGEPIHIFGSCKIFLLVLIAALVYNHFITRPDTSLLSRFHSSFRDLWQLRFTVLFTIFSLVLSTAIGRNWGPDYRSFYAAWPFLFALFLLPALSDLKSPLVPWTTAGICFFALLRAGARIHELRGPDNPPYMPGATIGNIREIDTVLADVQAASHHSTLLFAGPDMGAVLLYTNGVRVLDLGLLCDPVLARLRYGAVETYVLQQRKPDVIEVHSIWTKLTALKKSPTFVRDYRPVYVDGVRVFLRNNVIDAIDPNRLVQRPFDAAGSPNASDIDAHFYAAPTAEDRALNQRFTTYLVLSSSPAAATASRPTTGKKWAASAEASRLISFSSTPAAHRSLQSRSSGPAPSAASGS